MNVRKEDNFENEQVEIDVDIDVNIDECTNLIEDELHEMEEKSPKKEKNNEFQSSFYTQTRAIMRKNITLQVFIFYSRLEQIYLQIKKLINY